MPVRSPAPWFRDALIGLAGQTFTKWRLVVVMDGASVELTDIVASVTPGADVVIVEGNPGLVALLNIGLERCNAPLVARLDSDDIPHPTRLERQVAYMAGHPNCVLVGAGARVITEDGDVIGWRLSGGKSVRQDLRWRCALVHPTTLYRRKAVEQVGGYRPSAQHVEDFDLWLRLAAVGDVHSIPEPLLDYRVHSGQITSNVRYSSEARSAILESRLKLATAEGSSHLMARFRHLVWDIANRRVGR